MKKYLNKYPRNILCTVSSGYSSVLMAIKIRELYSFSKIVNIMANTSGEDIRSLEFMNKCDEYYNLDLVWVEGKINPLKGKGTSFKVVKYSELKTNKELFEEGIKKYGIPSKVNKWCNRELKINPIHKYAKTIFGKNYHTAIGIRVDELNRVNENYKELKLLYPLVKLEITSRDRNKFWAKQPIKLNLQAYEGNCTLCFEKSFRKLCTLVVEKPLEIKMWEYFEDTYASVELKGKDSYNHFIRRDGGHYFYRGNKSTKDLIKLSKQSFKMQTDEYINEDEELDQEEQCGSGCSLF